MSVNSPIEHLKMGMVMGEVSGDILGASLVQALKEHCADLSVEGILGPKTLQAIVLASSSLYPMDRLSIIGLVEALFRIPELVWIRHQLIQHFLKNPPQVFIGIDAPDFNLGLELKLKKGWKLKAGSTATPKGKSKTRPKAKSQPKIVHYVSPTVWAWRKGRIQTIKKAVDLMLVLFPFEAKFYEEQGIPVRFVGHPMADQIPLQTDTEAAKRTLGFSNTDRVMAILPGSRDKELYYMAEPYLRIAKWCYKKMGERERLVFVAPLMNAQHAQWFEKLHKTITPELPVKIIINDSRAAIAACDVALVKSGTATLEVMLHKKPMVATYRMNPVTFQIARRLVKIPYLTLPNLLAEEKLFPEFLQDEVVPERVGPALLKFLEGGIEVSRLQNRFMELHQILRRDASQMAAKAIVELLV